MPSPASCRSASPWGTNASGRPRRTTRTPATPRSASASRHAAPKPPASALSSTVTSRPAANAAVQRSSASSGFTKRASSTAASIPSAASAAAAASAARAGVPAAAMTTSGRAPPVRSQRARPIASVRGGSSGSPTEARRGKRSAAGPGSSSAVRSMCRSSFSSDGAMRTSPGTQRRYPRSNAPWCVLPSAPTRPAPVERERHRELLQRDVMDDLIERALEKRRVDGDDRTEPLAGEPRGEGDRVRLRDAHVVGALREAPLAAGEAGPLEHGGGDRHDAGVTLHLRAERVGEHLGVRRRPGGSRRDPPGLRVEEGEGVTARRRVRFRGREALPLRGERVEQHRNAEEREPAQRVDEAGHVVTVHGTDVLEAERLEEHAGREERLRRLEAPAQRLERHLAVGDVPEHRLHDLLQARRRGRREPLREPLRDRPDVGRDRHLVVVQDDEEIALQITRLVQPLERHPPGERAVADERDDLSCGAGEPSALDHAERRADGGGGVPDAEGVMLRLGALGKSGEPALRAQRGEPRAASGQELVRVGLVTDVPDEAGRSGSRTRSEARRSARPRRATSRGGRRSGRRWR